MYTHTPSAFSSIRPASIILFSLSILAITGFASPFNYNILPADALLELSFIIGSFFILRLPKRSQMKYTILSSLYIVICLGLMLSFRRANILDFAQAYKAFYYVAPLTLFVGKNIFRDKEIIKLLNILLTLFLLKYGYSRALNLTERMGERPGIFVENNFELIFLLIIFYITESKFTAKDRLLRTLAVVAIVFLSGSRSALLALIAMFLFMHIKKLNGKTIISPLTLGLLIAGTSYIFITRMDGDIQTIDRFRFLQIFLDETKNWEWYEYILGTLPLTGSSHLRV